MLRFSLKLAIFLFPLAALVFWLRIEGGRLTAEPFYNELEEKLSSLAGTNGTPSLIVAGDSRAETQVDPELMDSLIGLKTINVGTASCDLITLAKALGKRGMLDEDRVFAISVSSFQINDGALDPGYLSTASLMEMALPDAIRVFRKDPDKALPAYQGVIRRVFQRLLENEGFDVRRRSMAVAYTRSGFRPLVGKTDNRFSLILDPDHIKHTWYKHLADDGVRLRIFRDAIGMLGKSKGRFLIYHAGMSPAWRAYTRGTFVARAESRFSDIVRAEVAKYPNMVFIDFYNGYADRFPEDEYFDTGHLNVHGAELFTRALVSELERSPIWKGPSGTFIGRKPIHSVPAPQYEVSALSGSLAGSAGNPP